MESNSNRRRLANLLLQPRVQYRYGFYFFMVATLAAVANQFLIVGTFRGIITDAMMERGIDPVALTATVGEPLQALVGQTLLMYPLLAVLCMSTAIWITHKFVGPQVPIRRFIAQLEKGDYSGACRLRDHDQLHEIAAELTALAETLRERHQDHAGERAA